jgi:hypothetical protein
MLEWLGRGCRNGPALPEAGAMWPFRRRGPAPPEPTEAMREEARRNPGGWVYVVDGTFGPNEVVPADRIIGSWKVDRRGNLTGKFKPNPEYRGAAGAR